MALTQVKTPGLADGTDGQIITYDANGKATTVGPGTDGQVLTSTGAGSPPAFETPAPGVGGATGVDFNDNVKTRYGTGNDFEIYHDGSHSRITNSTGALSIQADDININNAANNEQLATFTANGSVELFYDHSKKFETTSDGGQVTGALKVKVAGTSYGDGLILEDNDSTNKSELTHVDGVLYISANASANHLAMDSNGQISIRGTTTAFDTTGVLDSLQLYYETDSGQASIGPYSSGGSTYLSFYTNASSAAATEKVRITSDGKVGIGDTSPTKTLTVGTTTPSILLDDQNSRTLELVGGSSSTNPTLQTTYAASLYFGTNSTARYYINGDGHFLPNANNTYDLGSSSLGFRNIHTNDLHLSNEGSVNDVDGTWGKYTIQEGEDDLFLINRRNGKKYKFNLTEVS